MKKILYTLALAVTLWSCKTGSSSGAAKSNTVDVNINLIDVKDDKVLVTVTPPANKNRRSYLQYSKNSSGNLFYR